VFNLAVRPSEAVRAQISVHITRVGGGAVEGRYSSTSSIQLTSRQFSLPLGMGLISSAQNY
jgi:hypothetical protein